MADSIQVDELKRRIEQGEVVHILDVRDEDKFAAGTIHVHGKVTENLPYLRMSNEDASLEMQLASLPKDAQIVTVCTTGNKAGKAARLLREKGFAAVSLEGGLTAWSDNE